MQRRTFVRASVAAGVAAAIPACNAFCADDRAAMPSNLRAVSGNGEEIAIESAAVDELATELQGALYLPADDGYDVARRARRDRVRAPRRRL